MQVFLSYAIPSWPTVTLSVFNLGMANAFSVTLLYLKRGVVYIEMV